MQNLPLRNDGTKDFGLDHKVPQKIMLVYLKGM
jgi:hypothetical protein